MPRSESLPDDHHVVRYVPWKKLLRDEDDNVLGFLPEAFQLRPDELTLSLSWLEFFTDAVSQREACVWIMRKAIGVGGKSAFGIANVGHIKQTCLDYGAKVRILHEPEDNNPAHAVIRRLPSEELTLLSALAEDAFTELILNSSIRPEPSSI